MNPNTKFVRELKKLSILIKKKIKVFQTNVIFSVFSLFLGFVFGNLFGTFLVFFRHFINWDVLIITTTILIIEFINYLNYNNKNNLRIEKTLHKMQSWRVNSTPPPDLKTEKPKRQIRILNVFSTCFYILDKNYQNTGNLAFIEKKLQKIKKQINFIKILNFYKIGLLLGFFIDAFKVGS